VTTSSGSDNRRKNRVVVRLRAEGDADELHRCAAELTCEIAGAQVVRVSPSGRVVLELPDGTDLDAVATELNRRPGVKYAEKDVEERSQAT
jgi:hypothetical protein